MPGSQLPRGVGTGKAGYSLDFLFLQASHPVTSPATQLLSYVAATPHLPSHLYSQQWSSSGPSEMRAREPDPEQKP